jgi:hypothetical protein
MRLFRICVYGLLLLPLLGTSSCEHGQVSKFVVQACTVYISTDSTAKPLKCTVAFDQCSMDIVDYSAAEAWIRATNNDVVTWKNDPGEKPHHQYAVVFAPPSPFGTVGNPNPPVTIGVGNTVTGGTQCDKAHPKLCDFKYTLTSDGTKCSDPGVHIDPNAL